VSARIDEAADANRVTHLVAGHFRANTGHGADHLVARNDRVGLLPPVTADVVNVGMANATKQNVQFHVIGTQVAAFKRPGNQVSIGGMGGVAMYESRHRKLLYVA